MSTATVTAKQMGALSVTAKVIANVIRFELDMIRQMLFVYDLQNVRYEYDISANNTSTLTYSAPNYTLTIS